ncbi:Fumarate reductase iron-sulfur subunit [Enhygromyxa salina]|uniref:Fumarate reductase iron-sulfur subunit n=1 Tax=Enhygromyxa salina TaxID=215803 RepID=A0A2S9YDT7_9BACT|nr:succinate dehydrogenase/fumarate reductase iron-sulfur subunit [Enhygromyxa salina]PRQ03280.1 Fumarate reductase iron-sulfur subunit [Enhygromyxa salina]
MDIKLKIWRQPGPDQAGFFEDHRVEADPHMSFLEMLDVLNEQLLVAGKDPVAFDHDCREGICGACSMVIDGHPHGPRAGTTTCQLHMREYHDGAEITIEPWRASAFPIIKDLVVDRSAFDRIQQAGGYVSVGTGSAPDANTIPIGKRELDEAFDYAACIGCGACVAACPNASSMLFVASKVAHLSLLPQGKVERKHRARKLVAAMDAEGFGSCTNHGECSASCPKSISVDAIALLNREFIRAGLARD